MSLTDDPGSGFATVWNAVVSELNGESTDDGGVAANRTTLVNPLTPQQRAWLNLVRPLTIVEGFALLSVPSSFVQNEIERHLRAPITDALSPCSRATSTAVSVSSASTTATMPSPQLKTRTISSAPT